MCDQRHTRTYGILLRLKVTRRRAAVAATTAIVANTAVVAITAVVDITAVVAITAVIIIVTTFLAVAVTAEVLSSHAEFPIVVSADLTTSPASLTVSPALVVSLVLIVSPACVPSVAVAASDSTAPGLRRRVIIAHRPVTAFRSHIVTLFRQVDKLSLAVRMIRRPALQSL
jgi:hypothetical protein